ncbi:MAG: hypothetical protein R3C59_08610 [Planctomycetaceae bacterium]
MPEGTNQLVGHQLVFALAYPPFTMPNSQTCAGLVPLMDLTTGVLLEATPREFPGDGLVFWWDVPTGEWMPGSLVVGKLSRADTYYGVSEDKSWYCVREGDGHAANCEILEYVCVPLRAADSLRCLIDGSRPIDLARSPPHQLYAWSGNSLTGPFSTAAVGIGGTRFRCSPAESTNGTVMTYSGDGLADYLQNEGGYCEAHVSQNTFKPADPRSDVVTCRYRLIRRQDLAELCPEQERLTLLTDEQVISKACRLITGRTKRREIRDQLIELLSQLNDDEEARRNGVYEGLDQIVRRIGDADKPIAEIAKALLSHPKVKMTVNESVKQAVKTRVSARAQEIEEEAKRNTEALLAEVREWEGERDKVREEVDAQKAAMQSLQEDRETHQERLAQITCAAAERWENSRNDILAEAALLQPLFGPQLHANQNGHANGPLRENANDDMEAELPAAEAEPNNSAVVVLDSPALTEKEFIMQRLTPLLMRHGCRASSDVRDFHAIVVAASLIQVDHPGWAMAYAESMGGTACSHVIVVEPDWLSFSAAWIGEFERVWRRAAADRDRLHIVCLEGLNRCPSQAWFRPLLHIAAGWQTRLPMPANIEWPSNIRVFVTLDDSGDAFPVPEQLDQWAVVVPSTDVVETEIEEPTDGHLPMDAWLLSGDVEVGAKTVSEMLPQIPLSSGQPWSPMQKRIAQRLACVGLRLGFDQERVVEDVRRQLRTIHDGISAATTPEVLR